MFVRDKMKNKVQAYIFLLPFLFFAGCQEVPDYDTVPSIQFENITKKVGIDGFGQALVDSIFITVKFEDGDANLGLSQEQLEADTIKYSGKFKDNFHVDFFVKRGEEFVKVESQVSTGGRFGPLADENYVGPIDGTLTHDFTLVHGLLAADTSFDFREGDTAKFTVTINDRDLNESNIIETPEIQILVEP